MAYKIDFKNNASQLWVHYSGTLEPGEIEASWVERTGDEARFKKVKYIIADYTDASLKALTTDDVKTASKWPELASRINPDITLIAIMPHQLEYGLSRMWGAYAESETMPWKLVYLKSINELNGVLPE